MKTIDNNNDAAGLMWVELAAVELDESTQGRVANDPATISEYSGVLERAYADGVAEDGAEVLLEGSVGFERRWWPFPAVVLFSDKAGRLWVGDGFHRVSAAHASEFLGCVADVREGGKVEALKYALGANASHGLRRGSEDLRRCVELASMEYPELSDRGIMALVGCSATTVGKYRPEGSRLGHVVGGDGKVYSVEKGLSGGDGVTGADECPVADGAEAYVDYDEVRTEVVAVERGGVVCGNDVMEYDVAFVKLDDGPGVAEVHPWVGNVMTAEDADDVEPVVSGIPTWGELIGVGNVECVRMRDASGVVCDMVRRELAVEWCAGEVDGVVRWDGVRDRPVSLEHAERERVRWRGEQERSGLVSWMSDLMDGLSQGLVLVPDTLVLSEVTKLLPRESVSLVADALKDANLEDCESEDEERVIRLVCLLLATPLLGRGVEYVECELLGFSDEVKGKR